MRVLLWEGKEDGKVSLPVSHRQEGMVSPLGQRKSGESMNRETEDPNPRALAAPFRPLKVNMTPTTYLLF